MAKFSLLSIVAALSIAACAHPSSAPMVPAPAERPATRPAATSADPNPAVTQQAAARTVETPVVAPIPSRKDSVRLLSTDVARRALEVFGDSEPTADASEASAPSWDIDVRSYESTSRVEHYVQMFSGSARERIAARLEAGTRYEPMIRAKMRDGGLPEDMYYLALVESGFDPNAYSRAAAVGMWQFMTSTARDMGMRVDWWVDERRDPVKSTSAAVRFIKGLRDQFGSLYLAAAAYNGGPVRIARGLRRYADDLEGTTGDDLFFALAEKDYLRHETREYVPQLIAAALIAKDPDRYGLKIDTLPPLAYDSVRVGPWTPLAAVADAAGEKLAVVQELNPHVLRGITPSRDSFFVRLPPGKADSFAVAFNDIPESERVGIHKVESKKGESLASIAKRAGLSTRQLASFNPAVKKLKSGNLAVGQIILVPTASVAAAATLAPDPSIERYSTSRASATHIVKSGETISGIAKRYHTTSAALMRENGLRKPLIFPGQSLVIGGVASARSAAKSRTASSDAPAKKGSSKRAAEKVSAKKSTKKAGAAKGGARN